MGMGEQQTHGAQLLILDETDETFTLAIFVHAAIDDDGLARFILDNVGALHKRIYREFLYLYHRDKRVIDPSILFLCKFVISRFFALQIQALLHWYPYNHYMNLRPSTTVFNRFDTTCSGPNSFK
jgi:hypothetical protein